MKIISANKPRFPESIKDKKSKVFTNKNSIRIYLRILACITLINCLMLSIIIGKLFIK